MRGWQWPLIALLVLLCTLSLGSCAGLITPRGNQLVTAVTSDPKTFNYALSQESPNVFGYLYTGLIQENGVTGELEPALAESWQIKPETLEIVFQLKPNLKWSDGVPLTSEDVVFTYNEVYFNPEIPTSSRDILRIGQKGLLPTVTAQGDRQVTFKLPEPFAPFLRNTGLPILPAHLLRQAVRERDSQGRLKFLSMWGTDTDPRQIVGNGPFVMDRYVNGQRLIFRRNPFYWRSPLPHLERFIWQIVESTDTAMLQFRSGGLDLFAVTPEMFALLKREEKRGQFRIYNSGPSPNTLFLSFNLNRGRRNGKPLVDPVKSEWFNDVRFRQAVAYALDRQRMINNIYQGLGAPQHSTIPVQSPFYFSPEQGLPTYRYDVAKAKALLQEAGFRYDDQGRLFDAKGNRVRFSLMTNAGNKIREAIATQIQQDLGAIGMQVDLQFLAFGTLVDRLSNSLEWEAHILGFTGGGNEPNSSANIWRVDGLLHTFNQQPSPNQPPLTGRVVADWEQRISDLYVQGAQELNLERRKQIYAEAQRLAQEYLPFIYLVNPLSLTAFRNHVVGANPTALGGALWNLDELKVQMAAAD
ncbi:MULTISPECIES: ABC transporter substrate-binding protein [unclassified Thermosynechococcus]|uniref:ABC transporter substrate-binding protein n=1 Tax=unclassified Thermosynechococcus TaxID=2622553 RepID=UPI001A01217C|nr:MULTISPECIES: ABC transporter substrate-binding protein [unclassified Thermosynechococcus]HIK36080.1 ABC transporter substrate-binding protein [Thermosynechococcus sp. M98_K2018_005]HIK47282.1 ABC transporter substrate-binding protein [Thermosynechococcus sp. M55_K2018_012]